MIAWKLLPWEGFNEMSHQPALRTALDCHPQDAYWRHCVVYWNSTLGTVIEFSATFQRLHVYSKHKTRVDVGMYITDAAGIVCWHSDDSTQIGTDYSRWNNIMRTLRGEYGARATPGKDGDPLNATLHISAPMYVDGTIIGTVTLMKEPTTLRSRTSRCRSDYDDGNYFCRLCDCSHYYHRLGQHTPCTINRLCAPSTCWSAFIPVLHGEVGELATAINNLQSELDGREFIEHYIQSITHELKSPLTAIAAHAELLEDENDQAAQRKTSRLFKNKQIPCASSFSCWTSLKLNVLRKRLVRPVRSLKLLRALPTNSCRWHNNARSESL